MLGLVYFGDEARFQVNLKFNNLLFRYFTFKGHEDYQLKKSA